MVHGGIELVRRLDYEEPQEAGGHSVPGAHPEAATGSANVKQIAERRERGMASAQDADVARSRETPQVIEMPSGRSGRTRRGPRTPSPAPCANDRS
jgi:hypothetical protein